MKQPSLSKQPGASIGRLMAVLALVCVWAMPTFALDYPGIKMFYPGKNDEAPVELKPTSKAYTYFDNGSKVVYNKARVIQNGEVLGTCTYTGSETGVATTVMDQSKEENAVMLTLAPGNFSLEIYEVAFYDEGEFKTYSNEAQPIDVVTYHRNVMNGEIVSETGFEDRLVLSYYPADANEGVKTYTFSKPILDKITAQLMYGYGEKVYYASLPHSLSDDGMTLSIDFRGACHNVETLAPGAKFVDDFGEPVDPPTTITLVIEGLNCVDGSKISVKYNPTGNHEYIIEGQIYDTYNYKDITFPTPVLEKAMFYNHDNPSNKTTTITLDSDMMVLTVENVEYIRTADVQFASGSIIEVVPYAELKKDAKGYTAGLPQSIQLIGSDNLVVSLVNVEYTQDDGFTHVIKPLSFVKTAKEISSLSELQDLEEGTGVSINISGGVKVTMSNDLGYTFIEDETAGLQVITPDYTRAFDESTKITGRINGRYMGYGTLLLTGVDADAVIEPVDVREGQKIANLAEITNGAYTNRLVTLEVNEDMAIAYKPEYEMIMVDDLLLVITDFIEDFEVPEEINDVTGILYKDYNMNQMYILARTAGDFNHNYSSIISLEKDTDLNGDIYDLKGVKVRKAGESAFGLAKGIYIINNKKVLVK